MIAEQRDIIWTQNLDDVVEIEITNTNYEFTLNYSQERLLRYSNTCSAYVIDINIDNLRLFIENILTDTECHFDYVIEDFGGKTGVATFIYNNKYIYYTHYDDVFANPYECVKLKVSNVVLDRLRNLSNYI